jgi:hypothetical protein
MKEILDSVANLSAEDLRTIFMEVSYRLARPANRSQIDDDVSYRCIQIENISRGWTSETLWSLKEFD